MWWLMVSRYVMNYIRWLYFITFLEEIIIVIIYDKLLKHLSIVIEYKISAKHKFNLQKLSQPNELALQDFHQLRFQPILFLIYLHNTTPQLRDPLKSITHFSILYLVIKHNATTSHVINQSALTDSAGACYSIYISHMKSVKHKRENKYQTWVQFYTTQKKRSINQPMNVAIPGLVTVKSAHQIHRA